MLLRCSKCGSEAGFLIETQDGRTVEIPGRLSTDRVQRTVTVTCTYCDNQWPQVPVTLVDRRLDEAVSSARADLQH